ncbi:Hypothetical predicted protein [Olea europaea subsp. europaea]|uniref:Uncharacterized protein n=1 Tax=Olea europaea subsp. europaea TaxID=158383 RepID=A0A8S0PT00_OLEEU|nr:Hypothetical predicted protein [Olea europaea subsp. europaea]
MSGMRHGHGIFRQFLEYSVQVMSETCQGHDRQCPGRVRAAVEMQADFQAFVVSGSRCASHVRDTSGHDRAVLDFQAVFGTPRAGQIWDAVGKHPDFQAFLRSFWTRCTGHGLDTARMQPDFQAFLGSF